MATNLHVNHFRFGIDELAENTHGWYASEDVNPSHSWGFNVFLLRFNEQETGGTAAGNTDAQFEYRKNGGAWTVISTTSSNVKAVAAVALSDAAHCTKRLSGTGTFETTGRGQTEVGLSGGAANDIEANGCSETECGLQFVSADVVNGDVFEFRLTSPDWPITMDVVPSITLSLAATYEYIGAGGAASGGASEIQKVKVINGAGGAVNAGGAVVTKLKVVNGAGGAVSAGAAVVTKLKVVNGAGGALSNGNAITAFIPASGGTTYEYIASGGVIIAGEAVTETIQGQLQLTPGYYYYQPPRPQPKIWEYAAGGGIIISGTAKIYKSITKEYNALGGRTIKGSADIETVRPVSEDFILGFLLLAA